MVTDPAGPVHVIEEQLSAGLAGERVDRVVSTLTELSRSRAAELIVDGRIRLNGEVPDKPSQRVRENDVLRIEVPAPQALMADPDVVVPLVHVDADVLVVDKPAGMVVHPGAGVESGTMIQGLMAQFPELAGVGPDPDRPGVVHRLDRGTSGLLLVARTPEAHRSLTDQLRARTVDRHYHTLVHGTVEQGRGVVDAPIGRSIRQPTRQTVTADGKSAITHYEVRRRFEAPPVTELECRLETGRTHQIRVHLEAIGHPVVGDDRYAGRHVRSVPELSRPFLHAATLGFEHPRTHQWLEFHSPLPDDLRAVMETLTGS